MKKCLKFISLAAALAVLFAACTPAATPAQGTAGTPAAAGAMQASDVQIALIAHSPDSNLDDQSFNQGAWDGIQRFLAHNGLPLGRGGNAEFYQPHEGSDVARIDLINDVIGRGANILILPGFHFESALYEIIAEALFPDTKFVLLDATPRRDGEIRMADNVAAVHYAEEQSGFLAGYAAVMEGHRGLGFMGGIAVPAVVRFGHGFIQGAEYAASVLGLEPGEVTINYTYLGQFHPDPAISTQAAAWFHSGIDVIFAAAGGAGGSVKAGAETAGGLVIGVDVDQGHLSNTVITSAIKALDVSVYDIINSFMRGNFRSGELRYDATNDGIGLAMGSARFHNFTQAQHDAIFDQIASGAITVDATVTPMPSEANLPIFLVTLNEI